MYPWVLATSKSQGVDFENIVGGRSRTPRGMTPWSTTKELQSILKQRVVSTDATRIVRWKYVGTTLFGCILCCVTWTKRIDGKCTDWTSFTSLVCTKESIFESTLSVVNTLVKTTLVKSRYHTTAECRNLIGDLFAPTMANRSKSKAQIPSVQCKLPDCLSSTCVFARIASWEASAALHTLWTPNQSRARRISGLPRRFDSWIFLVFGSCSDRQTLVVSLRDYQVSRLDWDTWLTAKYSSSFSVEFIPSGPHGCCVQG